MSTVTKISWSQMTWNPIRARLKGSDRWGYHCERISPGCTNCYASTMNGRMLPSWGTGLDYTAPNREKVDIFLDEKELLKPLTWKKPRRVFPCSMTDLFAAFVPDEMIARVFAVMALCPQHTFQVLTKRAERMERYVLSRLDSMDNAMCFSIATKRNQRVGESTRFPLPNVWLGVSVEDQKRADERIPHLLRTPAAVRFLSCEPLLEKLDITPHIFCVECAEGRTDQRGIRGAPCERATIDWCITGSESGPGARPCQEDWIRSLRDQCVSAGTAFFYKQAIINSKKVETPELDGRRWVEFPEVRP